MEKKPREKGSVLEKASVYEKEETKRVARRDNLLSDMMYGHPF